jgi:hypothetical protein
MKTSEQIAELAKALAAAQGKFPPIIKDKTALAGKYSYAYADLASVIEAVRPALAENGLAHLQSALTAGKTVTITTLLLHGSGQFVESDPLIMEAVSNMPQAIGSAISYGRRYQLSALLGLAAEQDDDGKSATGDPGYDKGDEPFAGGPRDDAHAPVAGEAKQRMDEALKTKAEAQRLEHERLWKEIKDGLAKASDETAIDCYVASVQLLPKGWQEKMNEFLAAARVRVKKGGKAKPGKCDRAHDGEPCGNDDCWLLSDGEPAKVGA